jgi:hypothetical protein
MGISQRVLFCAGVVNAPFHDGDAHVLDSSQIKLRTNTVIGDIALRNTTQPDIDTKPRCDETAPMRQRYA